MSSRSTPPCGCLACDCQLYHNLKAERDGLRDALDLIANTGPDARTAQSIAAAALKEIR